MNTHLNAPTPLPKKPTTTNHKKAAVLPQDMHTYFCATLRAMPLSAIDPSLAIGLICHSLGALCFFAALSLSQNASNETMTPALAFLPNPLCMHLPH